MPSLGRRPFRLIGIAHEQFGLVVQEHLLDPFCGSGGLFASALLGAIVVGADVDADSVLSDAPFDFPTLLFDPIEVELVSYGDSFTELGLESRRYFLDWIFSLYLSLKSFMRIMVRDTTLSLPIHPMVFVNRVPK